MQLSINERVSQRNLNKRAIASNPTDPIRHGCYPQLPEADELAGTLGAHDLSPSLFGNAHCVFH